MRQISKKHQVICVTHLATIAAKGDSNYFVSKEVINNKTRTNVRHLSEEEVLEEIARISSGSITDISIKHAAEMRKLKEICA
jgi:DNA repair protein RecN (Recombination protein N)